MIRHKGEGLEGRYLLPADLGQCCTFLHEETSSKCRCHDHPVPHSRPALPPRQSGLALKSLPVGNLSCILSKGEDHDTVALWDILPGFPQSSQLGQLTGSLHRPPRWPSGQGVRFQSGRSRVRIPLVPGSFFGVESYQWLRNWHSSAYPARRLVLWGQCWDWSARCQYTVTEWDGRFGLQLLSQCGCT